MIKKISEKNQPVLGMTEWWSMSKNYEAIVFIKNSHATIQLFDGSGRDHNDTLRDIYNILIKSFGFGENVYKLENCAYGTVAMVFNSL